MERNELTTQDRLDLFLVSGKEGCEVRVPCLWEWRAIPKMGHGVNVRNYTES